MGEQSPSESAAMDTSTVKGGRAAYAKATQQARQAASKKRKMDLEEAALTSGLNEDNAKDVYVRSQSGSIVRSASSGRGVTSSYGRGVVDEYRQAYRGTHSAFGKSSDKGSSIPANQSNDDAYAPQAERPQEPIIDPIQTADLSSAAKINLFGQDGDARARRKLMNRII